jgi:hypothetical protein
MPSVILPMISISSQEGMTMSGSSECRIGNDRVFILIAFEVLNNGKTSVRAVLHMGRNGSVGRQTIRRIVDTGQARAELEFQIGRAWHWLHVNGITLSPEANMSSISTVTALLDSVRTMV